ncbi:protein OS-9 [Colius striatus]|uniref:protein OS-9 n=1 Tax=Colius striatus TaxID=57412 RepID=UPI002B1D2276|nr:protein OS-9 [Colius striatus]
MAARRGSGPRPVLLAVLALLGPGRPLPGASATLDLQELSDLKYGLEILAEPVLAGQQQSSDVVTVASRFRQRYECRLPPAALRPRPGPDEPPPLYNGSGVSELLRPMAAAPCLVKTKDWWTYEFCYGRHIQQYHVEDSEVKGDILFLGYYQSAFDWDDEAAKASKQHRLKRYHSQSYGNGSRCDLTGRAREAEVRFLCEEGSGDYLARVDEPQSCRYVLTVHTARLCRHPALRPPAPSAQQIRCQPALSPAQYGQFLRRRAADPQLQQKDPETPPEPPEAAPTAPGNGDPPEPAQQLEATDRAGGQHTSARAEELSLSPQGADPRKKIHFKVIRSPRDLLQFIEELKESTKKAKKEEEEEEERGEEAAAKVAPTPPVSEEPVVGGREEEEEEEEDEETGELLRGFEKELEAVLLPRAQVAQLKEEVKSEMEKEFDNIINEVEEELEPEGLKGELDRGRATTALASTLDRLMEKLDGPGAGKEEEEEEEEGGAGRKSSDGRLRVRLSKIGPGGNRQRDPAPSSQSPPRGQPLESQVRELLAKEGLRAEGKIEIKIMTPGGAEEEEEEEGRWLSEEDSRSLKEIFLSILVQGTEEAQRERQRAQALEENYRFVWRGGHPHGDPPSAHSDSDDPEL